MTTRKAKTTIPGRNTRLPIVRFLRSVAQGGTKSEAWAQFFGVAEQLREPELVVLGHLFGVAAGAQRLEEACIYCGCTYGEPCEIDNAGTTCAWISHRPPVCSSAPCVKAAKAHGMKLERAGRPIAAPAKRK